MKSKKKLVATVVTVFAVFVAMVHVSVADVYCPDCLTYEYKMGTNNPAYSVSGIASLNTKAVWEQSSVYVTPQYLDVYAASPTSVLSLGLSNAAYAQFRFENGKIVGGGVSSDQAVTPRLFTLSGSPSGMSTYFDGSNSYFSPGDNFIVPSPSLYTLAGLSGAVYKNSLYAEGYKLIDQIRTPSFFGGAYASPDYSQIVLSFRGTSNTKNWINNSGFVTGMATYGFMQYMQAAETLAERVASNPKFATSEITVTGHSLGGAVAELVGSAGGFKTVAFNAPGVGGLVDDVVGVLSPLSKISRNQDMISNYRIAGDQVSLVGVEMGGLETFTILSDKLMSNIGGSSSVKDALVDGLNMIHNHDIDTIINQIKSGVKPISGEIGTSYVDLLLGTFNPVSFVVKTIAGSVSLGNATGHLLAQVLSPGLQFIDPVGGSQFIFTVKNGSPGFSSVLLPIIDDVDFYSLRYLVDGQWSDYTDVGPGALFDLPNNVVSLDFSPYGIGNNPVSISDQFVFGIVFDEIGLLDATIEMKNVVLSEEYQNVPVATPEPGTFVLLFLGSILAFYVRRKRV